MSNTPHTDRLTRGEILQALAIGAVLFPLAYVALYLFLAFDVL